MNRNEEGVRGNASARAVQANKLIAAAFEQEGWTVSRGNMIVRGRGAEYVVEVKTSSEGRSDRLIPLWSQACLQASRRADGKRALAVVAAPRIPPAAAEQILEFAAEYAPHIAAGVVDFTGLRRFRGAGLEALEAEGAEQPAIDRAGGASHTDLFSDLNQWMLKVLLAPELPDDLLTAPRARYRNAPELAEAAGVSLSAAYRFSRELSRAGYLNEHGRHLGLVRRESLFNRWLHSASRNAREQPIRLLFGDAEREMARLSDEGGCLGLFAAADSLNLGFVHGVPPHVYVPRAQLNGGGIWKRAVPAERNEAPDLILREPAAGRSVFRGRVRTGPIAVSDVIQVWLDVSLHPSRGQEQAELIRRRVLEPLIAREATG